MKNRTCSEEFKQYLREINIGKKHSKETRLKMSEKAKLRWTTKKNAQ